MVGYDYSKFEGCAPGSLRYAKDYWAPVDKSTDNIYARYDWTLNNRDKGYFQFYHNEYEYFNTGGMEEKTNGLDVQQAITLNEKNTMVIGASWRKADVETTPVEKGNNEYDESINNVSFFINDNWEFAPTWTLNAGVRYDKHSEAGSETTLSTGINKKINDKSHAYINWGQVFKAPSTDDLFYNNVNAGNFGNPNLKAETGETWTIGYETSLNNKTDFGINYFQSDLKDAIDWLGTDWYEHPQWGGYYTKYYAENIDEQEKKGMELTLNHRLNDNLDLMASYTYVQVKNNIKNQGAIKDYNYMPNTYRLGINYHDGKWDSNIWLRAGSGGSTSLNTVYAYGGDKTGSSISYLDSDYLTIDLAVTYKAAKDFKIFAKAYNILNEAYVEQAGVYNGTYNQPAQSRRFLIGAEYSF